MKTYILLLILMQLKSFYCDEIEVSSYSKVAKNGLGNAMNKENSENRVHRAREGVANVDFLFSRT